MRYEDVKRGSKMVQGADKLWRCDRCAVKVSNRERAIQHSKVCEGVPFVQVQREELQAVKKRKRRPWKT